MTPQSPALPNACAFTHREIVLAKNQPQYKELPAAVDETGRITTRWALTWRERFDLLFGANVFLEVLTYRQPLQPVKLTVGFAEDGPGK